MSDFEVRCLSLPEMEEIYEGLGKEHFPANERKPFSEIRRMYEEGCYEALGFYEQGQENSSEEPVAYAFYVQTKDKAVRLLDYYAVRLEYRGSGVGSVFLNRMKEWYKDSDCIILETEDLATAENEEERKTRIRRNSFYLQNEVIQTDIHVSYFEADYQIFYIPLKGIKSRAQVIEDMEKVYRIMFGKKMETLVCYREV